MTTTTTGAAGPNTATTTAASTGNPGTDPSDAAIKEFLQAPMIGEGREMDRNWLAFVLILVAIVLAALLCVGLIVFGICVIRKKRKLRQMREMEFAVDYPDLETAVAGGTTKEKDVQTALDAGAGDNNIGGEDKADTKKETPKTETAESEEPFDSMMISEQRHLDEKMEKQLQERQQQQEVDLSSTKSHTTSIVEKKEMLMMTAQEQEEVTEP